MITRLYVALGLSLFSMGLSAAAIGMALVTLLGR